MVSVVYADLSQTDLGEIAKIVKESALSLESRLDHKMVALESALDHKMVALDHKMVALDHKMAALESRLDQKMVALESRLSLQIKESALALDHKMVALESRLSLQINESAVEFKKMYSNEGHLFIRNAFVALSPAVKKYQSMSGFGVILHGKMYFVVPSHMNDASLHRHSHADVAVVNISKHVEMLADVCFIDISKEFIADPQIGDNLFAIGFDETSNHRLWSGIVISAVDEVVTEYQDADGNYKEMTKKLFLTSGGTVRGMSGAPVFNGCGLSGISVGAAFSTEKTNVNTEVLWLLGAQVTHVKHLIDLVSSSEAAPFAFNTTNPKICKIPIKEYCKLHA
jgi:hypothetical protein